jgi:hypothetical protein
MIGLFGFVAIWSLLANTLAATLWPHIDPSNIAEPFGAVLIPLWQNGFGPYGLPTMFRGGLVLSAAAPVFLGLGATIYAVGFQRPQVVLLPLLLGVAAGAVALLLIVPRSVVAHPKTERNFEYIQRIYEPRIIAGKRVPSKTRTLEALDPI